MEVPDWFKEEWIDTDAKALGVYMALLQMRFHIPYIVKERAMDTVRGEVSRLLGEGLEGYKAWKSAEAFLESLYAYQYDKRFKDGTNIILDNIESKYYSKFRRTCYRYYRRKYVEKLEDNDKKVLRKLLARVKIDCFDNTRSGSVYLFGMDRFPNLIYELVTGSPYYGLPEEERRKQEERMKELIDTMLYSRILWFDGIIPAPFLEDGFTEKLAPPAPEPARTEVKEVEIPIKIGEAIKTVKIAEYEEKTPTREVLEGIVRNVLEDLGFKVKVNERLHTRGEGEIEVDVWGVKTIGNTRFYVYASCKNWNRDVDRPVIDKEFGRIQQLNQIPHLKIFIAKRLTEPARQTALADGFITIELGEKTTTNNAREIYEIIAKHLKELFIGIAPPELQKFAKETKEISERLKSLAEEIERIYS